MQTTNMSELLFTRKLLIYQHDDVEDNDDCFDDPDH